MAASQVITLRNFAKNYSGRAQDSFVKGAFEMRVDTRGNRPHIYLFATQKYEGDQLWMDQMPDNAPILFQQALDQTAPHLKLHDVDWSYVDFDEWNCISFSEKHGETCAMHRESAFLYFDDLPDPQARMKAIIYEPAERRKALFDDPFYTKSSNHIIVPLPLHPLRSLVMEPNFPNARDEYETVLCDPQKFINFWRMKSTAKKPAQIADGLSAFFKHHTRHDDTEDLNLIDTSLERAQNNVTPQKGYPNAPAHISFHVYEEEGSGHFGFVNGRHRTANLAKLGAPFIPVDLSCKENLSLFKSLFEWTGSDKNPHPKAEPPEQ